MSTKETSISFDNVEAIVCIYVLSGFILSTSGYSVNVSADIFEDGRLETVMCQINNSILNTGNCPLSNVPIEYVEIFLTKNSKTTLCTFTSFLNCTLSIQDSIANSCGCYSEGNDIYIVNVTVTANRNTFDGATIDCYPNCFDNNGNYPLQNTYHGIPITFVTTTPPPTTPLPPTTPPITTPATTSSSENITAAPECNSSTANCNESDKCPVWCIVVAVCVPCGVCGITITVVIIIKKKKRGCSCIVESSEGGCNGTKPACSVESSEGGCNETKPTVQDTKEMEDKTKHHGTENRPKNAQGGSNRAEVSAQDTKEMQDKTKHLGTENSPEREKRRKKKKKKKPFQEVDGESVSRENKSTVNDHKAAQNDNSVSVNENSPITYNGELRSLPMPKTPHMTSVERNSTIFQSETPRKLPPLQPKAMIIP